MASKLPQQIKSLTAHILVLSILGHSFSEIWDIEIIPWKVRTNVVIHELQCIKRTNEWAQRTSEFFDASQQVNKNCPSTFHGMLFLFHMYWDVFFLAEKFLRLPANDCENTSFVQSKTQKILPHSVNLSMYEIKKSMIINQVYNKEATS